jgi:FkbM family methyltransferase
MSDLALHDGWYWPANDTDARYVITRDCVPDITALLEHIPGRSLIVQAGGNVGLYPVELAKHFDRVVTAEPDPTNWSCLWRNLLKHDPDRKVDARNCAFGPAPGSCQMHVVKASNCGAHRIQAGEGILVLPIDSFALLACDAIWLDVEGYELPALQGAEQTIERFSPVISIEDKGLNDAFGIAAGAVQRWLAERGYSEVARIGRDKVFRRTA